MRKLLPSSRRATGLAAFVLACAALPAAASELATATLSSTPLSPSSWQYSLTLTDTGTTDIGTFWFAWIPGQDYMPTPPTDIGSPASWAALVTGGNPGNGYAIQWVAGAGAALHAGESTSAFTFESATTPQQMAADSPFHPGTPLLTSFVYSGAPFSDAGLRFLAEPAASTSAVPEPASLMLLLAGGLLVGARVRTRCDQGAEAATSAA